MKIHKVRNLNRIITKHFTARYYFNSNLSDIGELYVRCVLSMHPHLSSAQLNLGVNNGSGVIKLYGNT